MFWLSLVCIANAIWLCDVGIPCQNVDVGVVDGSFERVIDKPKLNASRIFVTTVVDHRNIELTQHFVQHYRARGIVPEQFLFILHGKENSAKFRLAYNATLQANVSIAKWIGPFSATAALYNRLLLLRNVTASDWLLYADLDEFIDFGSWTTAANFTAFLAKQKYTDVPGTLIDRVSANGQLANITSASIDAQFPLRCSLSSQLLKASTSKIIFVRGDYRTSAGNHVMLEPSWYKTNNISYTAPESPRKSYSSMTVDHYKWTHAVVESLTERAKYYRDVIKAAYWTESTAFLNSINQTGRIDVSKYCMAQTTTAKQPTSNTAYAQEWMALPIHMVPTCQTEKQNCVTSRNVKPTPCTNKTAPMDVGFATTVFNVIKFGSILEVDSRDGCYSHYWGSSGRFLRFNASTSSAAPKPFIATSSIRQLPSDDRFDWIISIRSYNRSADVSYEELTKRALYGIVITPLHYSTENTSTENEIVNTMEALGFLYKSGPTEILRKGSSTQFFRNFVFVFTRRKLIAKHLSTSFLGIQTTFSEWTTAVAFAGSWYRVFVPPTVLWGGHKLVIGALTVTQNSATRRAIRETWSIRAKSLGCLVVFLVANPSTEAFKEAIQYGDMVVIEAKEVYNRVNSTLPMKTYVWIQLAARYAADAEWLFKCDDDTFLFPKRLLDLLTRYAEPTTKRYYIGAEFYVDPIRSVKDTRSYIPYDVYPATRYPPFMSGGAGYALSMASVRCLAVYSQSPDFMYFPLEDVSTGLSLIAACHPFISIDRHDVFRPGQPKVLHDSIVTMHYIRGVRTIYDFWHPETKM